MFHYETFTKFFTTLIEATCTMQYYLCVAMYEKRCFLGLLPKSSQITF